MLIIAIVLFVWYYRDYAIMNSIITISLTICIGCFIREKVYPYIVRIRVRIMSPRSDYLSLSLYMYIYIYIYVYIYIYTYNDIYIYIYIHVLRPSAILPIGGPERGGRKGLPAQGALGIGAAWVKNASVDYYTMPILMCIRLLVVAEPVAEPTEQAPRGLGSWHISAAVGWPGRSLKSESRAGRRAGGRSGPLT